MDGGKKSKGFRHLSRAFGSALQPNLAENPPAGLASGQSDSDLQPDMTGRRFLDKLTWRFRSPPPSPMVEGCNSTPDSSTAISASQSLAVSGSLPAQTHSSCSETSTLRKHCGLC